MFTAFNKALQHDKPLIHKSRRILLDLYRTLLLKFLMPSAFSSGDINIRTPYHHKSNDEIVFGAKCRSFMEEKKMNDTKISKLVNSAHNFSQTLNIGSCGLHTLHNSFQAGGTVSGWKVPGLLSLLYYLFMDSPSRREDFTVATESVRLPFKFLNHMCLENVPVVTRALEIWPSIVTYVQAIWKTVPHPGNTSYDVVVEAVKKQAHQAQATVLPNCGWTLPTLPAELPDWSSSNALYGWGTCRLSAFADEACAEISCFGQCKDTL